MSSMSSPIDPREEALDAARRSVDGALDLWEAPAVSPDFDRRLYGRIEESTWWNFLFRPQRLVPIGVAAAAVIATGLWIGRQGVTPAPRRNVRRAMCFFGINIWPLLAFSEIRILRYR